MIPAFAYHRPATLGEACELARLWGEDSAFLAGGTELIPDYHRGRERARHLIAIGDLAELRGISVADRLLRIGAATTVREIAGSAEVREWLPALAEAARSLGSPPVRSVATIGGNFCRAVPCADLPPVCIAGGAILRVMSANGFRAIDADRFFAGARQTVLEPGELVLDVAIPQQPRASGASYARFGLRGGSSLPVASVAARLVLSAGDARILEARLVLGAVAAVPLVASRAEAMLAGERPSAELFVLAAAVCAEEARPISDVRGTSEFRRDLVSTLARRALHEAHERAVAAARRSEA